MKIQATRNGSKIMIEVNSFQQLMNCLANQKLIGNEDSKGNEQYEAKKKETQKEIDECYLSGIEIINEIHRGGLVEIGEPNQPPSFTSMPMNFKILGNQPMPLSFTDRIKILFGATPTVDSEIVVDVVAQKVITAARIVLPDLIFKISSKK